MRKWLNKLKVCSNIMIHFSWMQENIEDPHQLEVFQHLQSVLNHSCLHLFFLFFSSSSQESRAAGPAPSFCYLLSGEESSIQPAGGSPLSPLYLPPTPQTLRDVLQVNSFSA